MSPPNQRRHHTTRIVAAVAAVLACTVPLGSPAAAEDAAPTVAELRAERQELIGRIAAATDELAQAEAVGSRATERIAEQEVRIEDLRRSVARRLVGVWVDAADVDVMTELRAGSWTDALTVGDRRQLQQLRREEASLAHLEAMAGLAAEDTRRARAGMVALRDQLERTIAERQQADAVAAVARARASAATTVRARAVPTTARQAELMARYPFGPVPGIPDGLVATGQVIEGKASWYGPGFDGRRTASGAVFDQEGWTVAHKTLPLGTILLVSRGDRHVLVLVNDRGPFVPGRELDLSKGVAAQLGTIQAGVATVRAQILVPAG
jgi:rare lipoprotein A (peptidoglycan hydrolase)